MRIKLDKEYIEDYQMARVKEDVKFFSEANTLGDLKRAFEDQAGYFFGGEVISAEVKAMDSGWAEGNRTIFSVKMVIDSYVSIYKISFYIEKDLTVDTRDLISYDGKDHGKLYTVQEFKLA